MAAARTRLDIATNNLANVSTDGFHKSVARGLMTAHGVEIASVASREHGALRHTGRPLDLAIVGDGDFTLRDASGAITHTRNGSFSRSSDGSIRDDAGRTLIGTHGPVHVAEGATPDASALGLPQGSAVSSGFLETANVDAIGEMVGVLAAQRSFESAQKVVSAIDGTRQKSANDVARVK